MKKLITICAVVTMIFVISDMAQAGKGGAIDPYIVFEGYQVGEGAPPEGGTIGSQATGPTDPWFGTVVYSYMDGWNHAPRVPASEYAGIWTAGGHAGTGTDVQGWDSLNSEQPGRYVVDFSGYEWESSDFRTNMLDPLFGHEYRVYQRMDDAGEGEWQILDTIAGTTVASGTVGDVFIMDVFYDPAHYGANAYVNGAGTITVENDGGDFYNELMTRWGTPVLNFTGLTEDPPIQAENPYATNPADKWALYGTRWTLTPVPEPTTICLLGLGVLGLIRKKR